LVREPRLCRVAERRQSGRRRTLTAPFSANSVETAPHNAVQVILRGEGTSAYNWNKPGDFGQKFAITVDPEVQKAVMDACRNVTGV
jgi:hypothetical protein